MEQIEKGFDQIQAGHIEDGLALIEKGLRDPRITDDVKFNVAQQYFQLGFVDQAISLTQDLIYLYPNETELTLFLAECYMENAQEDDAIALLSEVSPEEGEDYIRAVLLSAELYLMEGLDEVAEDKIKRALQHYSDEPVLHTAMGEVFYAQEKYGLAITSYEKGHVMSTYSKLADCYAHIGEFERALDYYKKAVTSEKENVDLVFGYGFVAYHLEEWRLAIDKFKRVLELDPHYTSVYPLLVEALVKTGESQDALNYIQEGIKYDQTNPYLYYLKGQAQLKDQHWAEAKESFLKALSLDDVHQPSLEQLIDMAENEEDWETAVAYLQRMMEHAPGNSGLHLRLAKVYEEMEAFQEAQQSYEQAYELDPENIEVLNQYGYLLRDEGKLEEAIRLWRQSLKLDPDQWEIEELIQRDTSV
ncbi:tetratricopeptide repeat protein [Caldalkalibacillus salinus]|uniref:tetratricopeptide repeat protein n=1 Tax=Caldalkalibacillus salinus TaxID=2803787 RepID=UPI001924E21C|nr:tetratricopeptide repeat protein [Caldalkalibacillus salinus]